MLFTQTASDFSFAFALGDMGAVVDERVSTPHDDQKVVSSKPRTASEPV